jgi:Zn-dependent protease with chaperone function
MLLAAFFLVSGSIALAAPRDAQNRRVGRLSATTLLHAPAADLVDRNRQNEAEKLAGYERPLFLFQASAEILALLLLWQTGLAARIRDALRRAFRYAAPTRFVFGGIMATTALAAAFPLALWGHRLARLAQLTPERILPWAVGYGVETLLIAVGVGMLATIVLALVDAIRTWYLVVAVGVVAFTLGYAAVLPVVEDAVVAPVAYRPAAALGARIAALERKAGFTNVPIVVARVRDRSGEASAYVEGVGPWRRIVLDDTLLATATPDEIAYQIAHELAHMAAEDDLRIAFALALLVIVSATSASRSSPPSSASPTSRCSPATTPSTAPSNLAPTAKPSRSRATVRPRFAASCATPTTNCSRSARRASCGSICTTTKPTARASPRSRGSPRRVNEAGAALSEPGRSQDLR